jgi:AraC-like DNA-binding protein
MHDQSSPVPQGTRAAGASPVHETGPAPSGAVVWFVPRRHSRQGRTAAAVAYVAAHFASKIALEQAAALCQLGATQFCRLFKMEQCVSFGQFVLRFRLERARELLAHSDMLVKEVAYGVGFNDLSYFARAFKRQFGVCPRQFQAGARSS